MSHRMAIGCPYCRVLIKWIGFGMAWTVEEEENIRKQKEKILKELETPFECFNCKKMISGRDCWMA